MPLWNTAYLLNVRWCTSFRVSKGDSIVRKNLFKENTARTMGGAVFVSTMRKSKQLYSTTTENCWFINNEVVMDTTEVVVVVYTYVICTRTSAVVTTVEFLFAKFILKSSPKEASI